MTWTDDPVRDQLRYDSEQEKEYRKKRHCAHCGVIILEGDEYYLINNEILCPECVRDEHLKVMSYW